MRSFFPLLRRLAAVVLVVCLLIDSSSASSFSCDSTLASLGIFHQAAFSAALFQREALSPEMPWMEHLIWFVTARKQGSDQTRAHRLISALFPSEFKAPLWVRLLPGGWPHYFMEQTRGPGMALVSSLIQWNGAPENEITELAAFSVHGRLQMVDFLFGLQTPEALLRFQASDESLRDASSLKTEFDHMIADELLRTYRWLRERKEQTRAVDIDTLFQALQKNHSLFYIRNPDTLGRGLQWLELQGFPLLQLTNQWRVNGLARKQFFAMDIAYWPAAPREAWDALRNDSSSQAVVQRIKILHDVHGLAWTDFGVTRNMVSQWARGIHEPSELVIESMGHALGIEPVWLTHGYSRTEFTLRIISKLRPGAYGNNIHWLRLAAGLSVNTLAVLTGLAPQAIRTMETGSQIKFRFPTIWPTLAHALGQSAFRVLSGQEEQDALRPLNPGERIALCLLAFGKTREELAVFAHVHPATVHLWVLGKKVPSGENQRLVAKFFGLSPDRLFGNPSDSEERLPLDYNGQTLLHYIWGERTPDIHPSIEKESFEKDLALGMREELRTAYGTLYTAHQPFQVNALFEKLKSENHLYYFQDAAALERGLKWLEGVGFPLLRSRNVWRVNGAAGKHFFSMDIRNWPAASREKWQALQGNSSGTAVGQRVLLLKEVYPFLVWDNFGTERNLVWAWTHGTDAPSDFTVEHMAQALGIEPVWLTQGYSRSEFEAIAYTHLRLNDYGNNLRWLRRAAGIGVQTLSVMAGLKSYQAIQSLENGKRKIGLYTHWPRIAQALDQSPFRLLTGMEAADALDHLDLEGRLRLLLLARGKTQAELSQSLRVSEQLISDWVTGKRSLSERRQKMLARVLQVSPKKLFKTGQSILGALVLITLIHTPNTLRPVRSSPQKKQLVAAA